MMMREYEYCLDICSLYVSVGTYIRGKKIWMDGDEYRGKDTRPHTPPHPLGGTGVRRQQNAFIHVTIYTFNDIYSLL
jgi:hypothetical protein